ncbi:ATP-dependent 6-phosphofructokinase [Rhodovibrionaceae bacterium A322]
MKKIGLLTSGGDCAGLNAVLRAVVHRAIEGYGWEVVGLHKGTAGLLVDPPELEPLTLSLFDGFLLRQGGTILGTTNKGDPFDYPLPDGSRKDRSREVADALKRLKIDALIGVGGDGSLAILQRLCALADIPMIGIPKTIDNDVVATEVAVGHQTAVNEAVHALDNLQPTAASHDRIMLLEVMGRDAGHLALSAGIAGGADVILIPEIPYSIEAVAGKIESLRQRGRNFALVVVAEAVLKEDGQPVFQAQSGGRETYGGIGHYVGARLADVTGAEVRVSILGHVQRGGTPTASDRVMASAFGVHAVDLIAQGFKDRVVIWQGREVGSVPLAEVVGRPKLVDPASSLVATARGLGICLGDDEP